MYWNQLYIYLEPGERVQFVLEPNYIYLKPEKNGFTYVVEPNYLYLHM